MIKHIFLDLDGTILDFLKAEATALSRVLTELGIKPTEEKIKLYSKINDSQWKRLEKGEISREQVLVGRFEIFFRELGESRDALQTRTLYEKYLSEGHFFIDGAEELLESLSKQYNLYLASNGTKTVQDSRIKSAGIQKYFKDIFVSQDIGFNKPDKRYFDMAFKKIENFLPDEAVIIGDSLSSDILGGNNAKIKTVWFNPNGLENSLNVKIDAVAKKLSDIPDILKKI